MKLIFLDIDGVLNRHDYDPKCNSSTIHRDLMSRLNKITDSTGAQVVLSSAWRYMIHGGAMTLKGFQYLLQTHGSHFTLAGYTRKDEHCVECGSMNEYSVLICKTCGKESLRGDQITIWRKENNHIDNYIVIDDLDLGISAVGHPFIKTDGNLGIQDENVIKSISYLKGKSPGT